MIWVILLHGDLLCADLRLFCQANRTTHHGTWQSTEKTYVSSEQYCSESWSPWTVGRMKYKFIIISLCEHIYSVELHKYYFDISELKGTERGGKTNKYLRKCLPCSYSKGVILFLTCIFPSMSKNMKR